MLHPHGVSIRLLALARSCVKKATLPTVTIQRAKSAKSIPPAKSTPLPTPDTIRCWSVNKVAMWALTIDGITSSHTDILLKNEVTGADMLDSVTTEGLERWGMPGGPAGRIMSVLAASRPVEAALTSSTGESMEASRGFRWIVLSLLSLLQT